MQDDAAGGGDVEGIDALRHRNADTARSREYLGREAVAFRAEEDGDAVGAGEIGQAAEFPSG